MKGKASSPSTIVQRTLFCLLWLAGSSSCTLVLDVLNGSLIQNLVEQAKAKASAVFDVNDPCFSVALAENSYVATCSMLTSLEFQGAATDNQDVDGNLPLPADGSTSESLAAVSEGLAAASAKAAALGRAIMNDIGSAPAKNDDNFQQAEVGNSARLQAKELQQDLVPSLSNAALLQSLVIDAKRRSATDYSKARQSLESSWISLANECIGLLDDIDRAVDDLDRYEALTCRQAGANFDERTAKLPALLDEFKESAALFEQQLAHRARAVNMFRQASPLIVYAGVLSEFSLQLADVLKLPSYSQPTKTACAFQKLSDASQDVVAQLGHSAPDAASELSSVTAKMLAAFQATAASKPACA